MAIRVKLDYLLVDRRLTLTDLADRIGITIANLSILKTDEARASAFPRSKRFAGSWSVSLASCGMDARSARRRLADDPALRESAP